MSPSLILYLRMAWRQHLFERMWPTLTHCACGQQVPAGEGAHSSGSRCLFIVKLSFLCACGLCQPAVGSLWGVGGKKGEKGGGEHSFLPSPPPRGLGKGSILRRGALSIRPRDANEGERVPTARTLCRAAHLLLGERPLCPRQFTGNLACANGPAPLCGRRRHWPPSVGTAAAPGPQAPGRCPRLYRAGVLGSRSRQSGTPGSVRSAPLRSLIASRAPGMAPSTVAVEMLSPKEKNRVSATRPARAVRFPRGLRRPPPT
jgi:hypothetical protein